MRPRRCSSRASSSANFAFSRSLTRLALLNLHLKIGLIPSCCDRSLLLGAVRIHRTQSTAVAAHLTAASTRWRLLPESGLRSFDELADLRLPARPRALEELATGDSRRSRVLGRFAKQMDLCNDISIGIPVGLAATTSDHGSRRHRRRFFTSISFLIFLLDSLLFALFMAYLLLKLSLVVRLLLLLKTPGLVILLAETVVS